MGSCLSGEAKASNDSGYSSSAVDSCRDIEQVQVALRKAGLEPSSLIVAVDFNKTTESAGERSNHNRPLHSLEGPGPNPFERVISILAKTLQPFNIKGQINVSGFGDASTQDHAVFHFFHNDAPARGADALLARYRELVPLVKLAGPTSFAPVIYQGMRVVVDSGCQFHILVIIAAGLVSREADLQPQQLSRQEQATINAIVAASELPLSIVMVGIGDGPWDGQRAFMDKLPERRWQNFTFVNFTELAAAHPGDTERLEAAFAMRALAAAPEQYKTVRRLQLLNAHVTMESNVRSLQPPAPPSPPPPPPHVPVTSMQSQPNGGPLQISPANFLDTFNSAPLSATPALQPHQQPSPFERWADGTLAGGKSPQQNGLIVARPTSGAAAGAVPSPFETWVSGHIQKKLSHQSAQLQETYSYTSNPRAAEHISGSALSVPEDHALDTGDVNLADIYVDPLFVCPLSNKVMLDPVMAADGWTYDRSSIAAWLQSHDTSPMTQQHLLHKELTPNAHLRSSIMEFLTAVKRN